LQVSDVVVEVIEGDARNVMCDAVDRHHASMLVVGSHNYGAVKRYSKELTLIPLQTESARTCSMIFGMYKHPCQCVVF